MALQLRGRPLREYRRKELVEAYNRAREQINSNGRASDDDESDDDSALSSVKAAQTLIETSGILDYAANHDADRRHTFTAESLDDLLLSPAGHSKLKGKIRHVQQWMHDDERSGLWSIADDGDSNSGSSNTSQGPDAASTPARVVRGGNARAVRDGGDDGEDNLPSVPILVSIAIGAVGVTFLYYVVFGLSTTRSPPVF